MAINLADSNLLPHNNDANGLKLTADLKSSVVSHYSEKCTYKLKSSPEKKEKSMKSILLKNLLPQNRRRQIHL